MKLSSLFLSLAALSGGLSCSARAEDVNPAVDRFGSNITFYASFDEHTSPDITLDPASEKAGNAERKPTLVDGLYGKAALFSEESLIYPITASLRFDQPGSLFIWVSPDSWQRGDNDPYLSFCRVYLKGKNNFIVLSRMPAINKNTDTLYACVETRPEKKIHRTTIKSGSSRHWRDGEWYLLTLTWSGDVLQFSINDRNPSMKSVAELRDLGASAKDATLVLGNRPGKGHAFKTDEVILLNRSVTREEIQQVYTENLKRTGKLNAKE